MPAGPRYRLFGYRAATEGVLVLDLGLIDRPRGETWQFEGPIVTVPSQRPCVYSIRTNNLSTGLVGVGHRCWRDDPEEGVLNRDNLGYASMDTIMVRSEDKGWTWSEPRAVDPPLEGPAFEISYIHRAD